MNCFEYTANRHIFSSKVHRVLQQHISRCRAYHFFCLCYIFSSEITLHAYRASGFPCSLTEFEMKQTEMIFLSFVTLSGISVSVSTFNLVAISLERYSAICNPLTSRTWQTKSHAAKVISATWLLSFLLMVPYPISSTLVPYRRNNNSTGNMCRHIWPSDIIQQSW